MKYQQGDYVEIGVGHYDKETDCVSGGRLYLLYVDKEKVEEQELQSLFGQKEPILYMREIDDEVFQSWAEPLSQFADNSYPL